MKRINVAAMAAAVTLALGACGASGATKSADATGTNRPSTSSSTSSSSSSSTEPEPSDSSSSDSNLQLKFGESATFDDGLVINVSAPKKFTPSPYAAADKAKAYVRFTVTVVNRTDKVFDPSMINATLQSANTEASEVFDTDKGLGLPPQTKILKGREAKYSIGFGVEDPNDLVLEITPGMFDYNSVIYTR